MTNSPKSSSSKPRSVQEACQPAPEAPPGAADDVVLPQAVVREALDEAFYVKKERRRLAQRARWARQERESVAVVALARRRSSCKRCGSTVAVVRVLTVRVQPDGFEVRSQVRLCRTCRQLVLPGFDWREPTRGPSSS